MTSPPESIPEPLLNRLLRQVDWRFLLRQPDVPHTVDLRRHTGPDNALDLVTRDAERSTEDADLVVCGFPSRRALRAARAALRPGGEIVCLWKTPRPRGARRALTRLRRAGFEDVGAYRPGPQPGRTDLWLPLEAPHVVERCLAERPPRSLFAALLRRAWLALAPSCAMGRLPGAAEDELDRISPDAWVLLTGGEDAHAKVVGLPFSRSEGDPPVVVKFSRVAEAEESLEREMEVLRELERERPGLSGIPRVRAEGRRWGRLATAQDAINGGTLNMMLDASRFAAVAPTITRWLLELAGDPSPRPASEWSRRLVHDPLDELERDYSSLLPEGLVGRARRVLDGLGPMPLVWEHRDFGPWNIITLDGGEPAVIDWEAAEPRGLPGLDLCFFLACASFAIDGSLREPVSIEGIRGSNERLLDPRTATGEVAGACVAEYREALGIGAEDFARLRLLTWIVQALAAYRRQPRTASGIQAPRSASGVFIHLVADELKRAEVVV